MTSQTAEYALRATIFLAEHADRAPFRVGDLADALDAPRNYLSKILHALAKAGVLSSARGPAGGFRLAVDAAELPLIRIVALFDPVEEGRRCVLGREKCSDANPCGAHARWKRVAEQVASFFRTTTVADVVASSRVAGTGRNGQSRAKNGVRGGGDVAA